MGDISTPARSLDVGPRTLRPLRSAYVGVSDSPWAAARADLTIIPI